MAGGESGSLMKEIMGDVLTVGFCRQLDGVPATIDVLQECVEAAAGRIRVHIDGGIRSGTEMFKALALGAECCWVGRPTLWGLAVSSSTLGFTSTLTAGFTSIYHRLIVQR